LAQGETLYRRKTAIAGSLMRNLDYKAALKALQEAVALPFLI
jgi:hypothetical protein